MARKNSQVTVKQPIYLFSAVEQFVDDPLGFVYFVFPWGEGMLQDETGPDKWQTDILQQIGDGCLNLTIALQVAVRSGHGIGKSALISWIILWFISTRPHPQIVVTANTKPQLETKTWRELAKWHRLAINRDWFTWTATKFYHVDYPETWFAVALPWSKERSEAFAGTHDKHVLMLFDEASAIDDIIWEVAEGAMTTEGAIWLAFGNPTRNTGRFSECFKKYRHRWITREIDSRTAKKANKKQLEQWIQDYGEDSDFVRVRVRGVEPRAGLMQLIPMDIIEAALGRSIHISNYDKSPKIIGVDIARHGDDQSVIYKRQGLYSWAPIKMRIPDNMVVAGRVAQEIDDWKADAVFIDVGAGYGVIDRLRQLGYKVTEVPFGNPATDENHYFNKRAEMWGKMRDWLKLGGCIVADNEVRDDLAGPEYGFDARGRIQLEKKEDMKKRGLASPDCGDALALTFAHPVNINQLGIRAGKGLTTTPEWSPFEDGDKAYASR